MENYIATFDWNYFAEKFGTYLPKRPFGAKYILCEEDGKKFFVADAMCEEHSHIQKKYLPPDVKVLGGGTVFYYGTEKGFVLTDKSMKFGPADHKEAKKLLEGMFRESVPIEIEE